MIILLLLALAGLADSIYLTWEHFNKVIPPCTVNTFLPILSDCGKVLTSPYSVMFGVPLAIAGIIHYGFLSGWLIASFITEKKIFKYFIILQSIVGAIASLYFMYIQIGIIGSICIYCTISAIISFIEVAIVYRILKRERFELHTAVYAYFYQNILKRLFFLLDPEFIHDIMVSRGKFLAKTPLIKLMGSKLIYKDASLKQRVARINFENPIGLAAGFDYNADLTQTLYYLDFGFQSVGTITNSAYAGNPYPRLGRLPKSRSLMVNKGFKNKGARAIAEKLKDMRPFIPVGISVGVTNSAEIKTIDEAVKDVVTALKTFEIAGIKNSYYEINVSCPNLVNMKHLNFYSPKNLDALLSAIGRLRIKKTVFVKMPIDKTNREVSMMMATIVKHKFVDGLIFGNLQKNKKDPSLVQSEVRKFKVGNFSGKACEQRSNELIEFAYKKYKDRFVIVGCGGVFNGQDAYRKIKLGASLIQLITGMIYQGPQVVSQINLELIELLKKDGYRNIKEAVGKGL